MAQRRAPVQKPSGSNLRIIASSSALGGGVSITGRAGRSGQPVSAWTFSAVTPGCTLASTISRVTDDGRRAAAGQAGSHPPVAPLTVTR